MATRRPGTLSGAAKPINASAAISATPPSENKEAIFALSAMLCCMNQAEIPVPRNAVSPSFTWTAAISAWASASIAGECCIIDNLPGSS